MTRLARFSAVFRTLRRDRGGVAAAEFALIASVMLTILLGVYDVGNAIQERMQLEQALRAGAQYALSWPDQTSNIGVVISSALPANWTNTTINVSAPSCYCWSSGGGEVAGSCSETCPTGSTKRSYLTLSASNSATPLLFSALTGNSMSYVVRFQ